MRADQVGIDLAVRGAGLEAYVVLPKNDKVEEKDYHRDYWMLDYGADVGYCKVHYHTIDIVSNALSQVRMLTRYELKRNQCAQPAQPQCHW